MGALLAGVRSALTKAGPAVRGFFGGARNWATGEGGKLAARGFATRGVANQGAQHGVIRQVDPGNYIKRGRDKVGTAGSLAIGIILGIGVNLFFPGVGFLAQGAMTAVVSTGAEGAIGWFTVDTPPKSPNAGPTAGTTGGTKVVEEHVTVDPQLQQHAPHTSETILVDPGSGWTESPPSGTTYSGPSENPPPANECPGYPSGGDSGSGESGWEDSGSEDSGAEPSNSGYEPDYEYEPNRAGIGRPGVVVPMNNPAPPPGC